LRPKHWHKVKTCEAGIKSTEMKLLNAIPKGFCDWAFPEEMKQPFLCCLTKATKI